MPQGLAIFSGRASLALASKVCLYVGVQPGCIEVSNFSDGEIYVQIKENVRGRDVFVIQSTCPPVNESLMELLIMIDALKRSSARRITAVIPYFGYARQDKKDAPRVPISAKLVADLIDAAGADRVLAMDLHTAQLQGFFDIPVDNLFASPVLLQYIKQRHDLELMVVSPDTGGLARARAFARWLDAPLGIIDKRRESKNVAQVLHIIGDVAGRDVLLPDDMIDTAGPSSTPPRPSSRTARAASWPVARIPSSPVRPSTVSSTHLYVKSSPRIRFPCAKRRRAVRRLLHYRYQGCLGKRSGVSITMSR